MTKKKHKNKKKKLVELSARKWQGPPAKKSKKIKKKWEEIEHTSKQE